MINIIKKYFIKLSKYEVYFFYILVLFNLLPVLVSDFFPTVDGPAHLYNSRLIIDLLSNKGSPISDFYVFNDNINPNWSGHLILSGLLYIFPAYLAEKILLISYLILFPISFRFLLNNIKIESNLFVYFIFPFSYSFLFYYGFYNFHIGLVFFFFTIGYWIKFLTNGLNYQRIFILLILSLCVFFSHVFVSVILLITVGVLNVNHVIILFKSKFNNSQTRKLIFKQIGILIPVIILTMSYFYSSLGLNMKLEYLSTSQLWSMVSEVQPAKGISYGKEGVFTKWIFILFSIGTVSLLISKIKSFKRPYRNFEFKWGALSLITLIMLFVIPDSTSTFGFISSRLVLFFFLFYTVFLSTKKFPLWIKIPSIIIIMYLNFALIKIYTDSSLSVKSISENIKLASSNIAPYSTVLTINDNDYWLFGHISNYLGASKPMILSDNYEASLQYFPLKWKQNKVPQFKMTCDEIQVNDSSATSEHHADYIFILTEANRDAPGENESNIKSLLENCYESIYLNEDKSIKLYKSVLNRE